jgi:hypothetical protein
MDVLLRMRFQHGTVAAAARNQWDCISNLKHSWNSRAICCFQQCKQTIGGKTMPVDKLKILKMMEEGKLTADEAAAILDAPSEKANGAKKADEGQGFRPFDSFSSQGFQSRSGAGSAQSQSSERNDFGVGNSMGGSGMSQSIGGSGMGQSMGGSGMGQSMGASGMSQSFGKSMSFASFDAFPSSFDSEFKSFFGSGDAMSSSSSSCADGSGEKRFQIGVGSGDNTLILSAVRGYVKAHGYNGDSVSAKVAYKAKNGGGSIDLTQIGKKISLSYDESKFESVSVDISIPERLFSLIRIEADASSIELAQLASSSVIVSGEGIKLQGVLAESLNAETEGQLEVFDVDASSLRLSSKNGGIKASVSQLSHFSEYLWDMRSGGKLDIKMPSDRCIGYHLKARASRGEVRIGLPGMKTTGNTHELEALSDGFDLKAKKVKCLAQSEGDMDIS